MNEIVPTTDQPAELVEHSNESGMAFVMPDQFPDLESAEIGMRIEKTYYEFNTLGEKVRAIFNGMDWITTKNNGQGPKRIPAIVFQTREGVYLNSGASLVEQFRTIPAGTPVQIEYLGTVKSNNNNNVKKFDVRLLKVGVKAVRVESAPEPVLSKFEQPIPSSPSTPPSPDGLVFTNQELATEFWTKARTLGLTRDEGLTHLAAFQNDFKQGLEAL